MRYEDALTMADNVMTYRLVVKEVAYRHGVYATFMPKPLFGENGSGMHTHMSLFKGKRNAFFDPKGKYHLSEMAIHFIGGLLKYAPEFTAVTCQWINSYKRLVPGYEAPVYMSWAQRNRSDLIRVPMYKPGKEEATRLEYRSPDPACNPYLAFSVMLAAGMAGVEGKIVPPNRWKRMCTRWGLRAEKRGIRELPGSLLEALQLAKRANSSGRRWATTCSIISRK